MTPSTQQIDQSSTTSPRKQSKRELDTHELFNDNLDSLLQDEPVFFEFEDIEIEHKQKKARRSSLPSMHIHCDNSFDAYTNNNKATNSKKNSSKRSKSLSMFHPNNDDKHHFDNDDNDDKHHFDNDDISVIDYRFEKINEDDHYSDDDSSTGDIVVELINDIKDEKSDKELLSSDDLIQPPTTDQNNNNNKENASEDSDKKEDEESEEEERVDFHQEFEDRLEKLQHLMMRSSTTQKALQRWDKKRGLPKNHSVTMVKSEDSRQKIQDEVILSKVVQEASAFAAASGDYNYTSLIDISAFL